MIRKLSLLSIVSLAAAFVASAQSLAITNAKVWTGTESGTLENATVIVTGDTISEIGTNIPLPSGTTTIDAEGKWLTPGIISPFSRVGTVEVGAEDSTNDTSASKSKFSAALRASDGFNPAATTIAVTRLEGLTRLAIAPGHSNHIIAGQGFIADTSGTPGSIQVPRAFLYIDLGEQGAGLAGGSRPAAWATLRGALSDARFYPARFTAHPDGDALTRADAQAVAPATRGQQLILIGVHRASDILKVLELKAQNTSLNIALVGADEAWMVAEELVAANVPVIIDPTSNLPSSFAQLGATGKSAERLIAAGVTVAFSNLSNSGHQSRLVLQNAGNAVANGVSFDDAMSAMTVVPAAIFGLNGYGSISLQAPADLVLWSGDPLEVSSAPEAIWIGGIEQPMESRQTRLRDRYLNLDESEKPLAFER